jgi:DNA replication protein DnaC
LEALRAKERRALAMRTDLLRLLGGERPLREFTLDRYEVTPGNRLAYERSKLFDPASENLYLWGPCGVGKTHLAYATARCAFEESLTVVVMPAPQLSRRVRMRDPEKEQATINEFAETEVLVLDDVGAGSDTAFTRQILQEILDVRAFHDRAGLVATSRYSLDQLSTKFGDDSIPSRIAGMCRLIEVKGNDRRLRRPDAQ